jgi:hypothetical protein
VLTVKIFLENQFIDTIHLTSLPQFHQYSIDEWSYFIDFFFLNNVFNFSHIAFNLPFFNTTKPTQLIEGELLFVTESILFTIIETKFPNLLNETKNLPIKVCSFYSSILPSHEITDVLKIKIRPHSQNLVETKSTINAIKNLKANTLFRLDGNRCFESSELSYFLDELQINFGPLQQFIEFIEEPLKNFSEHYLITKKFLIPIALDESLINFRNSLDLIPRGHYVIIKPSLLGLSKSIEMMTTFGSRSIISSSYETASASRSFFYLASINPNQYHGLDTQKFLPDQFSLKG